MQPRDVIIAGQRVRLFPSPDGRLWSSNPDDLPHLAEREAIGLTGSSPHAALTPSIVASRQRAQRAWIAKSGRRRRRLQTSSS